MKYFLSIQLLLYFSMCYANEQRYTVDFVSEKILSVEKIDDHLILQTDRQRYYSQNGITFQKEEVKYAYESRIYRYRITGTTLQIQPIYLLDHSISNISIRTHGKDFYAGYPGVHIENHEISEIAYCSGVIRKINNIYYVCFDGLGIYDPSTYRTTLLTSSDKGRLIIDGHNLAQLRDIVLKNNIFYLLTSTGLYATDQNFTSLKTIFHNDTQYENAQFVRIDEDFPDLNFIHSNGFYTYNVESGVLDTLLSYPKIDCINHDQKFLYLMGQSRTYVHKIDNLEFVDSIPGQFVACIYRAGQYIGFGLNGLWVYNKELYKLNEIEYNRRSVQVNGDTVRAGSTSGLYTYSITNLLRYPSMLNVSSSTIDAAIFPYLFLSVTLVSVIILILLITKHKKFRKSIDSSQLDRAEIEVYILNNLKTITVERVCLYFGITNIELNEYFPDLSPAAFIKNCRMELAKNCYENGESIDYISNSTGYSKSYLIKYIFPVLKRSMRKQ